MKPIYRGNVTRIVAAALTGMLLTAAAGRGEEIKVVTSATFKPAYLELVPEYERTIQTH